MPDIADFRAWDNRLLKDYSPGYFNINDEVLAHVKEVIWTKYGFMSDAVRLRSWQQIC
jgi:hypothetical protein